MNLPKDTKNIISYISSLQTLVMDSIPKTVMIAGTTAQTSVSNISRISETLRLVTSAAQDLPKTVQNLQSTITSFEQALAARRDSTGFTEMVAPVVANIFMGSKSIINGFIKTGMNYK